jgi:hypothetical protein
MTQKEQAMEVIEKLPSSATFEDILAELFFGQKVERGLKDLEERRVVSEEEATRRLSRWLQP